MIISKTTCKKSVFPILAGNVRPENNQIIFFIPSQILLATKGLFMV